MFKQMTPEERRAAARKAADTRRAKNELKGDPGETWLQVPVYSLRLVKESTVECRRVRAPEDLAAMLHGYLDGYAQEHLVVVLLDRHLKVIGVNTIYIGTIDSVNVRVAEVLRPAIIANACSIVVSHNHPSGDPTPSPEDVVLTRAIVSAARLLDMELLDHIVIGDGSRFVSLKERNLAFN